MWNISIIWIAVFLTHCAFALVGAVRKQYIFMYCMYGSAILLTLVYLVFPDTFLLPSVPKLYFVNYYNPGSLHWIMRLIFDVVVPIYFLGYLIYAYRHVDMVMRNRLKYFFVAVCLGYTIGSLAIPLVYDIAIDPAWAGPFVSILAIPMAYAIVRYNLMDIRVVAQRAFMFAVIVTLTSFGIFMVGYLNSIINVWIPGFPSWIFSVLASCVASALGLFTWIKFRETDLLKYEFITTMTHKLRTPLTSIRWSVENLNTIVPASGKTDLAHIEESANRLIELSNALAEVSSEEQVNYTYTYATVNMTDFIRDVAHEYMSLTQNKGIGFSVHGIEDGSVFIRADRLKIQIVLSSLMDNALMYTPKGGRIILSLLKEAGRVVISIQDTGIGFSPEESSRLFTRMYRTDSARKTDTEGTGIGLFVARKIVEHHDGTLRAHSDGKGRGSTFLISIPIWKNEGK
jgi:signal transduction histidine kinase